MLVSEAYQVRFHNDTTFIQEISWLYKTYMSATSSKGGNWEGQEDTRKLAIEEGDK